jgi:hypothetical protein|tara:strand:+ start:594 stop:821 length:228 start_codon:yes stop_codon:yes gene_type:complete
MGLGIGRGLRDDSGCLEITRSRFLINRRERTSADRFSPNTRSGENANNELCRVESSRIAWRIIAAALIVNARKAK